MSLISDAKSYLVANGQSANLYLGRLPDDPDMAAALFQYAGRAPLFVHSKPGIDLDRPALHVLVRDTNYAAAESRAMAIYALLASVVNATLGSPGTFYERIEPLGSPYLLERDAKERTVFGQNHYVIKQP